MEILFLIIGVAIGLTIGVLLVRGKLNKAQAQSALVEQQLAQQEALARQQQEQQQALAEELRGKLSNAEKTVGELREQLTDAKVALQAAQTELQKERENTSREAQLRQEKLEAETQLRQQQLDQQLKTIQEQFSNLANKVLAQTSQQLKATNTESMETLTKPLQDNLKQLQEAIRTTNSETAKHTASLSEQLKAMTQQTEKIDQTATRLTNVIRGDKSAQGNMGERLLTEILDMNGYRLGVDYDVQQTLTDRQGNIILNEDSGRAMRPDVIIHYPGNEDVVVDSKMSIEAYYQYVNTEDQALRRKYADDLVRSIRAQAAGLAKKDYSSYIPSPRHAIDYVIMFVPNDGALQTAISHDPRLWGEAFNQRVFITGQQNLMAILKIIQIAWRQYAQTENQKRVFALAEEMLKRVGEFVERFNKVGKDLLTAQKDYEDARNKVFTGRQSIVQKANELKLLGAKEHSQKPIPETEPELNLEAKEATE